MLKPNRLPARFNNTGRKKIKNKAKPRSVETNAAGSIASVNPKLFDFKQ